MLVRDLIVLGRACPEPLKDGRVTVCLAGWSESHGFMRLYPTRHDMGFKQWDVLQVDVERNERDSRQESWKIVSSKSEWETLSSKVEVVGHVSTPDKRRSLAVDLCDPSVDYINGLRRSLGIIKPNILRYYLKDNPKYFELFQLGLPGLTEHDQVMVKRDFTYEPRTTYTCPEGENPSKQHDQQILEWGFYEWFRKNPDNQNQVWKNAGFDDPSRDIYYLIGNQAAHRNSFMVISVLRFSKGPITRSMLPLRRVADDFDPTR